MLPIEDIQSENIDKEDELRELQEQLFRQYGEISRSPSPESRGDSDVHEELLALEQSTARDKIKERATLVLDLRASAHAMQVNKFLLYITRNSFLLLSDQLLIFST